MARQGREGSSASIWWMFNIFKISGRKRGGFNTKGVVLNHDKGKAPLPRRSRIVRGGDDTVFWGAAEPDIDQKATDYIARFYQHRS